MDYLQLVDDNVSVYNLKYKDISKSKNATGDADCDKFCKIVCEIKAMTFQVYSKSVVLRQH